MASKWFIIRAGKKYGPYSSAHIKGLAERGKVRDTDLLWKEGMEQPRPAGQAKIFARPRGEPVTAKPAGTASEAADDTSTRSSQTYATLKEGAKSAARMAAIAAERAKLVTLTLPGCYRELGESGYQHREMDDVCADIFSQLDALTAITESYQANSSDMTVATTISGKAKALAAKGIAIAKHKQASVRQAILFVDLGKAIYEKADLASDEIRSRYGAISGRISECLRRIEEIDKEKEVAVITTTDAVGLPASPRLRVARYAVVGVAVSGVLLSGLWVLWRPAPVSDRGAQTANSQPQLPSDLESVATPAVPPMEIAVGDMTSRLNALIKPRMSVRGQAAEPREMSSATEGATIASPQHTVAASRVARSKEQPPTSKAGPLPAFTPKTRENSIGMQLIQLPPGAFTMAEDPSNPPGFRVEITHGFWIGKYEVTQKQWATVRQRQPSLGEAVDQEQRAIRGDDLPAVGVDWLSAKTFCEALTEMAREVGEITEEQRYRLPTDAEWEYACRAGTDTPYCFGKETKLLPEYAWFYDNTLEMGMKHPRPVGLRKPNAWGLYDTHGNVKEWCADGYRKVLPGGRDPFVEPVRGGKVVVRGGSYRESAYFVQSWFRAEEDPENSSIDYGFRVVLDDHKDTTPVADLVTQAPSTAPPPVASATDDAPATVSVPEPTSFINIQGIAATVSALLRGERSLNAFDLSQVVGSDPSVLTLLQGEEVTLYGSVRRVGTQHSTGEEDTTIITFVGPHKYAIQCKLPKLEPKAEWLPDHKAVIRGRISGSREMQGLQGKQEYLVLDGCRVLEPDLAMLPERPSVVGMSREENAAYAETLLAPDRRTVGQVLWSLRRLQGSGSIYPTEGNKQDSIEEALSAFGGGVSYALPSKGIPLTYSFDAESVVGRVRIPTQKWESTFGERRELKVLRDDIDFTESYKQELDRYIDPNKLAKAQGLGIGGGYYYTPSEVLSLRFWETECRDGAVVFYAETMDLPQLGLVLQIRSIGVRMK